MRPDELERRLRERLDALGPRAELLQVLMLPDFERAHRPEVLRTRVDARALERWDRKARARRVVASLGGEPRLRGDHDLKATAERLGHTSTRMVDTIYLKLYQDADRRVADAIDDLLRASAVREADH